MKPDERDAVKLLRSRGYAVVVYNPEELGDVDARQLEDTVAERGSGAIEDLQSMADIINKGHL